MKRNLIRIRNFNISIDDLTNHLMFIPSEEIVSFFNSKSITINTKVIRETYKQALDDRGAMNVIVRNMSPGFVRMMEGYENFTAFQYMNLIEKAELGINDKAIRQSFWSRIFEVYEEHGIDERDIVNLLRESEKYKDSKKVEIPIQIYSNLNSIGYDDPRCIDGCELTKVHSSLLNGSTMSEIVKFSELIRVPNINALSKEEYLEAIVERLNQKGIYNPKLFQVLKQVSYTKLEMFAIDNGLRITAIEDKKLLVDKLIDHASSIKSHISKQLDVKTTDPLDLLGINLHDENATDASDFDGAQLNIVSLIKGSADEPTVNDLHAATMFQNEEEKDKVIDLINSFEEFEPSKFGSYDEATKIDEYVSNIPLMQDKARLSSNFGNVDPNQSNYDYSSINAVPEEINSFTSKSIASSNSNSNSFDDDIDLDDF